MKWIGTFLKTLWNGFYRRPVLLALLLIAIVFVLCGCAVPVRPIAYIEQDPETGSYHFTPDPEQEPQASGLLSLIATALPGPWGEIVSALIAGLGASVCARRGPLRKLKQTITGIENAKAKAPAMADVLHDELGKAQDEDTKRTVWEMRP